SASVPVAESRSKDPYMPALHRVGEVIAPKAPQDIAAAQVEEGALTDLAVKLACTTPRFTTDWMATKLYLSIPLAAAILDQLCTEGLMEETMKTTQIRSHYRITQRGREHGAHLLEVCRYIGPAPVGLGSYAAMLRWQFANTPQVQPEHVAAALSGLVLSPKAVQLAGLAVSSGRSLFVFGPAGNGKSSLGRQI